MAGIVVSRAYAMSEVARQRANQPILGWMSYASFYTLSATSQTEAYPATNLANPSTANRWESDSTSEQFVTVMFGVEREVDYVGIARHNLGSGAATVSIEGLLFGGDPENSADWFEIFEPLILPDDGPRIFRFVPEFLIGLRLRIVPAGNKPRAAVLKVGKLTTVKWGLPPGHKPIKYARSVNRIGGRAESGDYLGSVIAGASLSTTIDLVFLEPDWYRTVLEPFRLACEDENPFFWAWAPARYPDEVGYCWVTNSPMPTIAHTNGMIEISFAIDGIAL